MESLPRPIRETKTTTNQVQISMRSVKARVLRPGGLPSIAVFAPSLPTPVYSPRPHHVPWHQTLPAVADLPVAILQCELPLLRIEDHRVAPCADLQRSDLAGHPDHLG